MRVEKPVGFSWGGSFPADQHPSIHLMGSRAGLRRLIGQRNLFYVEYGICRIGGKYITFAYFVKANENFASPAEKSVRTQDLRQSGLMLFSIQQEEFCDD